jgi:SAM-dependent methyltransferase
MTSPISSGPLPRWVTKHGPGHAQWYIERFRRMAAEGADLAGEARLVDVLVAPGSRILDAGAGSGRIGAEVARRGHVVVGVDYDAELVVAAQEDHPDVVWLQADLATLDLAALGQPEPFDAVVMGGNVMPYLAPGTEAEVLRRLAQHVRRDAPIVVGFGAGRGYEVTAFDADIAAAGLVLEQRFGTWDLRPWTAESDFSVSVLRRPAGK